jgi:hypothetical protein
VASTPARRERRRCVRANTDPPRPIVATVTTSTAISAASATAAAGTGRTSGDGRPGVPSEAARVSTISPSSASSPTRPWMALRVRPVRNDSSLRDSTPSVWSCDSTSARFDRRTSTLFKPPRGCLALFIDVHLPWSRSL